MRDSPSMEASRRSSMQLAAAQIGKKKLGTRGRMVGTRRVTYIVTAAARPAGLLLGRFFAWFEMRYMFTFTETCVSNIKS